MGTSAVTSLSLGGYQTCAISLGKAYCWGRNDDGPGQVGDNSVINRSLPVAVYATGALTGKTLIAVAASGYYSCAIGNDYAAYCWGRNTFGQLGDGTTTNRLQPVKVNTSQFKPIFTDF
jgi:alpha-tubulin suppressor-like RCC1 family protein